MKTVRTGLDADAGYTAFGVAKLGIERCSLNFELLHNIRRWNEARDDLVSICRSRAWRSVNQKIAAISTCAIDRIADDVRRLEGSIESCAARVRDSSRKANECVRVAVDEREFRKPLLIHSLSEVAIRSIELRSVSGNGDSFSRSANFKRDVQLPRFIDLE